MNSQHEAIQSLIDTGKEVVGKNLTLAAGGNLSARILGTDKFAVTASGSWLDRLTLEDFSIVNLEGHVVGGNPRPSVEWKLHLRAYQVRSDINAVVHVHPQMAVLLDAMKVEIRLITLDHVYYLKKIASVPFFPSGSEELAEASSDAAKDSNAIILGHHGCSTLGEDVPSALRRALLLEEAANNTYRALALGNKTVNFPGEWLLKINSI
jgi:L-fuculose-phosphate aldolase